MVGDDAVVDGAGEGCCESERIEEWTLRGFESELELARLLELSLKYRDRVVVNAVLDGVMIEGSMIVDDDGIETVGRRPLRGMEEIGCYILLR